MCVSVRHHAHLHPRLRRTTLAPVAERGQPVGGQRHVGADEVDRLYVRALKHAQPSSGRSPLR